MTPAIRAIPGFPSYGVSTDGRIWRVRPDIKGVASTWKLPRPLKLQRDKDGYLRVALYRDAATRPHQVARLVLEAFVGAPPPGRYEAAHWNGIKDDNRLENLRWATSAENKADMKRHGTQPMGRGIALAKLTDDKVVEIRRARAAGKTCADLAGRYGISAVAISSVVRRRTWKHVHP